MNVPSQPPLKWRRGERAPEIYSNLFDLSWTTHDVRIHFGQITPVNEDVTHTQTEWGVDERGAATISWSQAKALRDTLTQAIERYEAVNGPITEPTIP